MTTTSTAGPAAFLEALFGEAVSPERRISVVALPGPRTRLCSSAEEAAEAIAALEATHDCFTGLGLVAGSPKGRGTAEEIAAIGCLWADIDLAGEVHANERLPRSEEDVRRILDRVWATPTAIVRSGHGYHAYWLLTEPWVFADDEDRQRAAWAAKAWHDRVCDAAASLGFKLENLGDLSRVLRVPGTMNRKDPARPARCEFVECDLSRRHHLDDLLEMLPQQEPAGAPQSPPEPLSLREDAEPPAHLCMALAARSEAFRRTWARERRDLRDASPSAHDLSLATIACLAGWRDQHVADLLAAHRRHHEGHAGKALRLDYVARTLAKAREAASEHAGVGGEIDVDRIVEGLLPRRGPRPVPLGELLADHPHLREPVIHGLLRKGETMNVVAPAKAKKTWLITDLAISIATGRPWLGTFPVEQGRVLVLDNELHEETIASRIPRVAQARGVPLSEIADRIEIASLRGNLEDVMSLAPWVRRQRPGRWQVVVMDALYRFMPPDTDENDNGTMARVYNQFDNYSNFLLCSFVLVHHASKGTQSGKAVTDVGAGAGAQSRATDTHLVLRPHQEDDCVVAEAVVRSWPPVAPRCLRWQFPLWEPDDTLDPEALRQERPRKRRDETPQEAPWTAERFAREFLGTAPVPKTTILLRAVEAGLSERKASTLLRGAEAIGMAFQMPRGPSDPLCYSRLPKGDTE